MKPRAGVMRKTQTRTEDTDTHSGAGWLSPQGDRLLRVLLTHASDAIIVRDAESGVVLDLNGHAETLYGYTHAEVGCFPHGWDPRTDEEQLAGGTQAVGGGAAHTSDQRPRWHRRRDGSVFPAEVTITRLDIDGRSLELATVRDLSEPVAVRSAMEARLVEAEGLLDLASLLERFTNLDHLLDGIVEAAMRFVGADFGAIGYPEGAAVRIARIRDNAGWGGATILLSPEGSGAGDAPHFDLDGVVTVLD